MPNRNRKEAFDWAIAGVALSAVVPISCMPAGVRMVAGAYAAISFAISGTLFLRPRLTSNKYNRPGKGDPP